MPTVPTKTPKVVAANRGVDLSVVLGGTDDLRPEGPQLEARRAEGGGGGGVLGEGAASPLPTS